MAADLIEAIDATFLRPMADRLREQIGRALDLNVRLKIEGDAFERRVISTPTDDLTELHGEVRILASDTAVPKRYKYVLECLFERDEALAGFSGFKRRGAVTLVEEGPVDGDAGFSFTYSDWSWGPKLRDF